MMEVRYWQERTFAIAHANELTRATEMQHRAEHVKGQGWAVRNVVTKELVQKSGE